MISLAQIVRGYDPEKDAVRGTVRKNGLRKSVRPSAILSGQKEGDTEVSHFKMIHEASNGAEWERTKRKISPVLGRKHILTDADLLELEQSKYPLFEDKAREIKVYWAAGFSIQDTVAEIDAWGFGNSTITKYFACFSRAHVRLAKSRQLANP